MSTNLREPFSLFLLLYKATQTHGNIMSVPVSVSTKERLTTDEFSPSGKNMIPVNVSNV